MIMTITLVVDALIFMCMCMHGTYTDIRGFRFEF